VEGLENASESRGIVGRHHSSEVQIYQHNRIDAEDASREKWRVSEKGTRSRHK